MKSRMDLLLIFIVSLTLFTGCSEVSDLSESDNVEKSVIGGGALSDDLSVDSEGYVSDVDENLDSESLNDEVDGSEDAEADAVLDALETGWLGSSVEEDLFEEAKSEYESDGEFFDYTAAFKRDRKKPNCRNWIFQIYWGNIKGKKISKHTHWNNSHIKVVKGGGAVRVVSTVFFDRPERDYILDQETRKLIEFNSRTRPHYDGFIFEYIYGCGKFKHQKKELPELELQLGENLKRRLVLRPGKVRISHYEDVDELGNGLGVHGTILRPGCNDAFVAGRWNNHRSSNAKGKFNGFVITYEGEKQYKINGAYGNHSEHGKVFNGKVKDLTLTKKKKIGNLAGHYDRKDGHWFGRFFGLAKDFDGEPFGAIRGRWIKPERAKARGSFHGFWSTRECRGSQR